MEVKLLENDWITIIFFSVLLLITITKALFGVRFSAMYINLFNDKYSDKYGNEYPVILNLYNTFLFPVTLLVYSLLIVFSLRVFYPDFITFYSYPLYMNVVVSVMGYFVLKSILNLVFSFLVKSFSISQSLLFKKMQFRYVGTALVYVLLLMLYYTFNVDRTILIVVLVVFVAFTFIGNIYSMNGILSGNKFPIHYILLYLCTLEIAPLLLYVKYISNWLHVITM
ncbi:MAG: DUF4271 domain-containing protein [Ichthyobacteriaceae bacterium]|nr:DUF4271 domain-containing protein [Ichthyobacteriaceae bacterium]